MAAFGFSAEDFEVEIEVWPDCWASFECFAAMQTQWRTGMAGATGLCYESLYPYLDRVCKTDDEWDSMFSDIQVMEGSALRVMREKT